MTELSELRNLIADARDRRYGKLIITADEMESIIDKLEHAEKRVSEMETSLVIGDFIDASKYHRKIQELESRSVQLPKKNIGWDKDGEDCWNNAIDACAEAIRLAGIIIRGDESD